MTDHLKQWQTDADALEIPRNIQRGLAFFAGIDIVANGAPVERSALPFLMSRINRHGMDLPSEINCDFYDQTIAGLLLELGKKLARDFEPRIIDYHNSVSGARATFPSFEALPEERLPKPERWYMAEMYDVAKALYSQVGDAIDEGDLEDMVVAGLMFFDNYYRVDAQGTLTLCRAALHTRPPHMSSISRFPLFDVNDLRATHLINKVLDALLLENRYEFELVQATWHAMWSSGALPDPATMHLSMYARMCLEGARNFVALPELTQLIADCTPSQMLEQPKTAFRDDYHDAMVDFENYVKDSWGFLGFGELESLYLGERYDRLAFIITAAVKDAFQRRTQAT